ncbi:MAG: replication initiation protein [Spiroplasma ixodetis]|nr:replication initiation protein [Spiroplasma ixodetis]MBP1526591.1 replication initiation protein [Spiroplasma ixodetis]MBP1528226.1 replication initiation protein [Spiroplasma ixodetis]
MENVKNKNNIAIYYANELARKNNQFTLEEEKVLHLIFSQIKPFEKNPTTFKIEKKEFFRKLNLVDNNKYKRYEKIILELISKTLTKIERKDTDSKLIGVVICNAEWFNKEPFFEVDINPKFMPYIEQLINHYTKVSLDSLLNLKSKHSLSLYKWLCSWTDENKKINQRYLTTKELKELFGLSIDDYVYKGKFNRADFERYTLKKIEKEINAKTSLIFSYKKNKIGNKIQNYEFTWTQKEKTNNENQAKENTNKRQSLNDKQTQMLLDNIDSN